MLLVRNKQLKHMFLRCHGTMVIDLNVKVVNFESVSSYKLLHPLSLANSMAFIAPRAWQMPRFSAKQTRNFEEPFLNITT
jgi:hypothetical protein